MVDISDCDNEIWERGLMVLFWGVLMIKVWCQTLKANIERAGRRAPPDPYR
jgi:hypothetical protein